MRVLRHISAGSNRVVWVVAYYNIFQPTQQSLKLIGARLVGFEEVAPVLPCFMLLHFLLVLFGALILWRAHIVVNPSFFSGRLRLRAVV